MDMLLVVIIIIIINKVLVVIYVMSQKILDSCHLNITYKTISVSVVFCIDSIYCTYYTPITL